MPRPLFKVLTVVFALCALARAVNAATIFQAANSQHVVWEAEDTFSIINAAPTFFMATNDATASGNRALYQAGANGTAAPSSRATYAIRFRAAGTYSLYLRWRADSAYTDLDPNSANSYYRPNNLGNLGPEVANFAVSSANNTRVPPAVNSYGMTLEGVTYTVTQEEVNAGAPVILTVGTREAGMFIDRFVLSQNPALTEAEFNALDNSETDIINQGANETFVAFEAERVGRIVNNPPTLWAVTNDATASGNQALYQAGANGTAAPSSLASFSIRFRSAGTYSLYLRWRGDTAYTSLDPNSANSYYRPNDFGDLGPEVANFAVSSANNTRVPPAVNSYGITLEGLTYTVTQEQVNAGQPLILKVGTREAGMFIDRFVLSQNPALTEAEFNALPNSGSVARPSLTKAVGSASLNTVTVSFDRPINPASVLASRFTLSGGVNVTAATLNTGTSRDVVLTTTAQTQGTSYVVTVNGVTDVSNNAVAPNSQISFTAWRISTGWITRERYFGTGASVAELQANPAFPNNPNIVDFVREVSIGADLQQPNYGARFRGFFVPPQTGAYEFYIYADDDAMLSLSSNESENSLAPVLLSVPGVGSFDASVMYTSGNLSAGQRYLFEVLYQQGADVARLGVGVRRVGTPGPVAQVPLLGGSLVSTFVNPDNGVVNIARQPASATIPSGTRAKLSVSATAPSGGVLFYQWQVNGVNIPNATRPNYVTPVLTAADNGKVYRCIIGINGTDVPSAEAVITVGPADPSPLQPYVGINFVGGSGAGTNPGFALAADDVAGVVLQEFFNNIEGTNIDGTQPLVDAQGAATPVTVTVMDPAFGTPATVGLIGIGTGNTSADHALLQGCIAYGNQPLAVQLGGVPPGTYNLIVYSVGFNFNSTYEEDFDLAGATTYPKLTVRGQHAREFLDNPVLVRMASTNPANRAHGNYVMFENVSPAADGSLVVTLTPQSGNVGNAAYFPPVNALQLVKVQAITVQPGLSAARTATGLTVSWGASASGFVLESSPVIGAGASWTVVSGAPNPISGAGSINVTAGATAAYYRLRR